MLIRLSMWLHRVSKGWVTLTTLVIFILFTILVLPNQTTSMESESGNAGSPDLSFFYTTKDLYEMAEIYGEQGRREYIRARFTFDIVWPIVYTVFLATALSWLSAQVFTKQSPWQRCHLLPLFGAVFDYLENISTSIVMFRYPRQTAVVDVLATLFTPLKWTLISLSFILLVIALGKLLWTKMRSNYS